MRLEGLRRELAGALRRLSAGGLVLGTAGNVSARDARSGFVVVSPSSLPYDTLEPEGVCVVSPVGELLEGPRPSVEMPMHLAILRDRPDVGSVVHTHSGWATALGCVVDEIPVVAAEQAATVGGPIAVCPYAPTGEESMGAAVLAAAGDRWAAIMRNHGPICLGRDLEEALACAFAVEESARIYGLARLHGEPSVLPDDEVDRVARRYARRV